MEVEPMDVDEIMEDVPLGNVYSGSLQEVIDTGKKYKLIYLDPPWHYDASRWPKSVGKLHYPRMTEEELVALPVPQLADKSCIMFMWTTAVHLPTSFRLLEKWGFTYKTVGFTWVKLNKDGTELIANGPGSYTRSGSEFCLIATKGSGFSNLRKSGSVTQVILASRREHSRKPEEAVLKLQQLFGDISRIELFSRCPREGWDVWGNEPTKFT